MICLAEVTSSVLIQVVRQCNGADFFSVPDMYMIAICKSKVSLQVVGTAAKRMLC